MSPKKAKIPKPSKEELALKSEQAANIRFQREILEQQREQQELMAPLLWAQMGIKPVYTGGKITGYEKIAQGESPEEALLKQIVKQQQTQYDKFSAEQQAMQKALLERQKMALEGTFPVSPAFTRQRAEGEQVLRDVLFRQGGTGYDISTGTGRRLADYGQQTEAMLMDIRHGELTSNQALALARGGDPYTASLIDTAMQAQRGAGLRLGQLQFAGQAPYEASGLFGAQAGTLAGAIGRLQQERLMEYERQKFNQGQRQAWWGAVGSAVGGIAGGAFGGPMGGAIGAQAGGSIGSWAGGSL